MPADGREQLGANQSPERPFDFCGMAITLAFNDVRRGSHHSVCLPLERCQDCTVRGIINFTSAKILVIKASTALLHFCPLFCLSILSTGCATNPERLQTPSELTCIYLKEPLATTGHYGLLNVEWTTRLERGPYWSEKMDEKGTFFRGPPGGVSIRSPDYPSLPGQPAAADGGFYLPKDPKEPVKIYRYFTTKAVPVEVPPDNLTCDTLAYVTDPASHKISLMSFTAGGAIGGAAGGLAGRSLTSGSGVSYSQAAGAGAVGGAAGGLIVGAIINADVGKIIDGQPIQEPDFMEKLRELDKTSKPLKQVPLAPLPRPDIT